MASKKSSTSKTTVKKENINVDYLVNMFNKYRKSFENVDIYDPIMEKGADGNCLFYSILQSETLDFHKKVGVKSFDYEFSDPNVPRSSRHFKNGMALRKYIGENLRHAYDYNNGLKNTIGKQGSKLNRKKIYEKLKPIIDVFGSANNDFAFNGDGDIEVSPYDDYMKPYFFAGDMTLTAYTLLFKKHIIIFNMSSPYTVGTVTFRKVEGVPFMNNFNEPNYIFLVRSGGVNTHFRTVRSFYEGEQPMLHDDVIEELNKNNADQLSYREFKKILSVVNKSKKTNVLISKKGKSNKSSTSSATTNNKTKKKSKKVTMENTIGEGKGINSLPLQGGKRNNKTKKRQI